MTIDQIASLTERQKKQVYGHKRDKDGNLLYRGVTSDTKVLGGGKEGGGEDDEELSLEEQLAALEAVFESGLTTDPPEEQERKKEILRQRYYESHPLVELAMPAR